MHAAHALHFLPCKERVLLVAVLSPPRQTSSLSSRGPLFLSFGVSSAGAFVVKVIHGTHDIIALPHYGQRLARRLGTVAVMVEGAHFSPRENAREVRKGKEQTSLKVCQRSVSDCTATVAVAVFHLWFPVQH